MKHMHADLIIEWANGAKIQRYWESQNSWVADPNPTWSEFISYQKAAPDDYTLYGEANTMMSDIRMKHDNIAIVFDGSTHKPKSAQILS